MMPAAVMAADGTTVPAATAYPGVGSRTFGVATNARASARPSSDRRKLGSGGGVGGGASASSVGRKDATSNGAEPPKEARDRQASAAGTGPPSLRTPQQQQLTGDAQWRQQEVSQGGNDGERVGGGGGGGGRSLDSRFASWTSFGSVTQDKTSNAGVGQTVWNESVVKSRNVGGSRLRTATTQESGQWSDVVPRRIKELLSRKCPLGDESQGLVTLFLDKEYDNICWCPPGAAELVPDERYSLSVRSLVEVVPGDSHHPRRLSLRAAGREHLLTFELDCDELYDVVSKGIVRILERNHLRNTLVVDPRDVTAI
eukprot:g7687.t1